MSSEYLNIKIKLSKSQFRLISKKVPPADLSLKLHYVHKNYFEGPKIYTLHCENFIQNNGLYKGETFGENDVFQTFFLPQIHAFC